MTESENELRREAALDVVYLAACMINDIRPDKERVSHMDLKLLYTAAKKHQMTSITAMALESVDIKCEAFIKAKASAIRKLLLLDMDKRILCEKLSAHGIWYTLLKGSVLLEYYPRLGMREMADIDILFDAQHAKEVKRIMTEELHYTVELFDKGNHDVYLKPPVSNFEMHRSLFDDNANPILYDYFRDIESRLVPDKNDPFSRRFRTEDFYIYITAHAFKHFSHAGTGLRSLADTYVYFKKFGAEMDMDYIAAETKKIGIDTFEQSARSLAQHLFDGDDLTDEENRMLNDFIAFGAYGTLAHQTELAVDQNGTLGFFTNRLFMPYKLMAVRYPVLRKLPFLLPVFWVVRMISAALFSRKRNMTEFKTAIKTKDKKS